MTILIKNVDLVPINGKEELIKNTNIYIKDNSIFYIGELKEEIQVDKVIDGKNKVAMPGLINAHTHIGMSLLRNFADDLPLYDWLTKKIWPIEAKLRKDDIYWGSLLSMVEMIQGGTTAFCDMYFFMDEVGKGLEESGIRGALTRGLIEDDQAKAKINETRELFNNWNGKGNGRIKVMVAPHAPYTCSPDFIKETIDLAKELNTGIHIHLSETKKEVEDSIKSYGQSPIKHVSDLGLFDPDKYDLVYTCGPTPMMEVVMKMCKDIVPVYVSMENRMACGIGACLGCTVETIRGMERVCKEGPVFLGKEVILHD